MIAQEYKKIAQWAMEFALSKGCSAARVGVYTGSKSSFEYRSTQLDKLEQASENSMNIELFVDERYGTYSTNRLEKAGLEKFILSAITATRYLDKDPLRTLPDASRYYKGKGADLKIYDPSFSKIEPDTKIALAKASVKEVFDTDPRIISVSSTYSDGENFSYMVASNGFEGEVARSRFSLSTAVSLKGDGDARPEGNWYETALFYNDLIKKGVGTKAFERTVRKLGQHKIGSGQYALLLDNMQVSRLLSPMIGAMSGSALQQKNSFLMNKLNESIASSKLTLTDRPHLSRTMGARWFDGEGVATQERAVIEQGILKTYFIDTYNAAKLKMQPTVQSTSILSFGLGNKSQEELLASMDKGIWVTGFNGGNSNSTSGDFSFGVEGFLVEKGKPVQPINEMNITGNLLKLWSSIAEIGNNPYLSSSWQTPSILFDGVDFSGL